MTVRTAPRAEESRATASGYRGDIQGLRALAILAVVAYHAGVPGISGGFVGVDFFFVLSGYLITGLLISERLRTGAISLPGFWARRTRRLLPASALALVATALASSVILPVLERRDIAIDIAWAALFSANWRLAEQRTDYLAQDRGASPVQHFWSLGVEEQFYLGWPLLIVAVLWAHRRVLTEVVLRRRLAVVFALVGIVSFAFCVHETAVSQPYAFFGTGARAWQLAVGALLAAIGPFLLLSRRMRGLLGLAGVGGFLTALFVLSEAGANGVSYPSWLALLPTLSAALLLAAGAGSSPTALTRVLSTRPLRTIGDLSYSWYLWHWPVLVLLPVALGGASIGSQVAAVLLSFGLAWASYRWVERPIRTAPRLVRSPARSLALGLALVLATMPFAGFLGSAVASVRVIDPAGRAVALRPNPAEAGRDVYSLRAIGCDLGFEETRAPTCLRGDPVGANSVVLIGDSHATAAFPGVNAAAKRAGWRLHVWAKSACPIADVTKWDAARKTVFGQCDEFRTAIVRRTIAAKPDVVILAMAYNPATRLVDRATGDLLPPEATRPALVSGLRDVARRFVDAGIRVVVIQDLPRAPFNPPNCLVEEGAIEPCVFSMPDEGSLERDAVRGISGAEVFDLTAGVCGDHECVPVVDGVLVYRDTNHITKTYSLALADRFAAVLDG